MKIKFLILFIIVLLSYHVQAQDSLCTQMRVDENLRVSIPKNIQSLDTTLSIKITTLKFRVFKATTWICNLGVTVTPNGVHLNADDEESWKDALDKIGEGACEQAGQKGFRCQIKDSSLDGLPCKEFEIFYSGSKYPTAYNYLFLVNDKLYTFTVAPLAPSANKIKLADEKKRFLNSIRFAKTIKERRFASKAESAGYKFGYLIPWIFGLGCLVYIIIRLVKAKR